MHCCAAKAKGYKLLDICKQLQKKIVKLNANFKLVPCSLRVFHVVNSFFQFNYIKKVQYKNEGTNYGPLINNKTTIISFIQALFRC